MMKKISKLEKIGAYLFIFPGTIFLLLVSFLSLFKIIKLNSDLIDNNLLIILGFIVSFCGILYAIWFFKSQHKG